MGSSFLRLLVLVLGLSHIICLNAVPVTRIGGLILEPQVHQVPEKTHHLVTAEKSWEAGIIDGRMTMELNDYPGSGANNRHTPRQQ